jgi:hypothetical protein
MREDIKQEWEAALRSREDKQAKGGLRTEEGHCCLGVLCDLISKKPEFYDWRWDDNFFGRFNVDRYDTGDVISEAYVPDLLAHRLSLPKELQRKLANANDKGHSFEQIAEMIEEML